VLMRSGTSGVLTAGSRGTDSMFVSSGSASRLTASGSLRTPAQLPAQALFPDARLDCSQSGRLRQRTLKRAKSQL
jgi:hypothetical protein